MIDLNEKGYGLDSPHSICFGEGEDQECYYLSFKVLPERGIVAFAVTMENSVCAETILEDSYPIAEAIKGAQQVSDYAVDTPYSRPEPDYHVLEGDYEENRSAQERFLEAVREQIEGGGS